METDNKSMSKEERAIIILHKMVKIMREGKKKTLTDSNYIVGIEELYKYRAILENYLNNQ